jgi:RNA polymerase sigma factor (sigma-70 family)
MHADQRYIQALRQNDPLVTKEIYRQHATAARIWIIKNSGTAADAQDVFQEAVMAVYEKALDPNFELTCPLGALLHLIYSRKWIDRLRKNKRDHVVRKIESERYVNETDPDALTLAAEVSENAERASRLARAFAQLSELCQQMLRLLGEGIAPKDVAEQLQMNSVDTLYRRKNACAGRWRELMTQ